MIVSWFAIALREELDPVPSQTHFQSIHYLLVLIFDALLCYFTLVRDLRIKIYIGLDVLLG